MVFHLLSFTSF